MKENEKCMNEFEIQLIEVTYNKPGRVIQRDFLERRRLQMSLEIRPWMQVSEYGQSGGVGGLESKWLEGAEWKAMC